MELKAAEEKRAAAERVQEKVSKGFVSPVA